MDEHLHSVSPDLIKVRYFSRLPWLVVPAVVLALWAYFSHLGQWVWYVAAVLMVLTAWQSWLIPRQVQRLGWLETEEDLLLSKGRLWHTFTMVPYGRVQYIDVTQGPFERMYGLKTLRLNTASASIDASVSGLEAEVADQLRERIARRAKETMIDL